MNFIKNLSIKKRLLLILIVPIIAIIIIGEMVLMTSYNKYNNYTKLEQLMSVNAKVSLLLHETQKERGASAGFIGSKGAKFSDILSNQRKLTENRLKEFKDHIQTKAFKEAIDAKTEAKLNLILNQFSKLSSIRGAVDRLDIKLKDALAYYTNINADLLHLTTLSFKQSQDSYITTHSMAFYSFLEAKERAGIERAVGSAIFSKGKAPSELKTKFINLVAMQNAFTKEFLNIADQELLDYYKETVSGKSIDEVNRMRSLILNANSETTFDTDPTYWFKTITKKINLLKKVDDYTSDEIIQVTQKHKSETLSTLVTYSIFILFIVLFTFLLSRYINYTITDSIGKIRGGVETFFDFMNRKRNTFEYIDVHSKGELGEIAQFINKNLETLDEELEKDMKCAGEAILVLNKLQQGHLNNKVMSMPANPQIRTFATTINKMLDNQAKVMTNILNELEKYTNYDYTSKLQKQNMNGEMEELINGINSLGDAITQMLIENKNNGDFLIENSEILLKNVEQLNNSAESQAASIEETAASIEETNASISEISGQAEQMQSLSSETLNYASEGQNLASKTQTSMEEINNATQEINEAITVIDQIAFQTNILSLNAAVEAATAGEAGKGFAVVAQEVRNLASRSAEAAKEIKEIVEKANLKASEGKESSIKMIEGYSKLNDKIQNTSDIISSVANSTKEQSSSISQINEAISKIDKLTQENAKIASETREIAIKTNETATNIIKDTNTKQFNLS